MLVIILVTILIIRVVGEKETNQGQVFAYMLTEDIIEKVLLVLFVLLLFFASKYGDENRE